MSHAPRTIREEQLTLSAGSGWSRLPWIGLGLGAIGILVSVLRYGGDHQQFYYSWLFAFLYFLSLALGGMFFVLIHFVTKAGWSVVVRRLAENIMGTIPLFALLFVPIALGIHELFHWSHADAMAHDPLLQGKEPYLNQNFFLTRAALYFLVWTLIAVWYRAGSVRQDTSGDHAISRRLTRFSGPAMILYALTLTFAAFDWIMTLDPHWYSTIFGVYYFAGCLVGVFGFMILIAVGLSRAGYLKGVVTLEHFHDLGKLLFAFTVFWAYIGFSQFFLIWYANIPEETLWYLHRMHGSWKAYSIFLAIGHFAVPFLFLMPRTVKRKTALLVAGALWMMLMHAMDLYWLIMPNLHTEGVSLSLTDLSAMVGIGGLFLATFGWLLRRQALVPLKDPRLIESLSFLNF
jgi:hypothetical protein